MGGEGEGPELQPSPLLLRVQSIWDSSTQSGAHFSCTPGATAACTPGLRTWTCEHLISPRAALGELELEVGRKEYVSTSAQPGERLGGEQLGTQEPGRWD